MSFTEAFLNSSNRLFGAFFCLSLFLHFIMVTAVPFEKLLKAGMPLLHDDSVKESESVTIAFELESPQEVPDTEEETPLQEKRLSFVDTSDSPLEEEPQVDTDKVGVKAMVAKDTYEGKEDANNQPHSEGNSTALFLSEGETPFADASSGDSVPSAPVSDSEGQDKPKELWDDNPPEAGQLNEAETADEEKGDSNEDKEGLDTVENPTLLTQVKPEDTEVKSIETPLELEDEGERVAVVTPPKRQKRDQKSMVKSQESGLRGQGSGLKTQSGTKKGSPVIYEDTISNAPLHGEESFNVQRHEYAEYFQHIRSKIAWYWFLSYGHDQSIKLETKNRLPIIIEFKILPSGRTDEVEIIEEAGNPLLASRIQLAIQTARLNSFPSYVQEDFITVRFNFYFL